MKRLQGESSVACHQKVMFICWDSLIANTKTSSDFLPNADSDVRKIPVSLRYFERTSEFFANKTTKNPFVTGASSDI